MQKLLIYWVCGASLLTAGCSTVDEVGDVIPRTLESSPIMYKIDIQQGNVVDQEMINRLQPGMSKSQVRYIMGTPLLVDVFHQDRWDYHYSLKKNREPMEKRRVTLFFENDRLARIQGDLRPLPVDEDTPLHEAQVYSVPDYQEDTGILSKLLEKSGIKSEDD